MNTLTKSIKIVKEVAETHNGLSEELRTAMKIVASKAKYNDNDLSEISALKKLIHHAYIHSAYENCGYRKMSQDERELYDAVCAEISVELNDD